MWPVNFELSTDCFSFPGFSGSCYTFYQHYRVNVHDYNYDYDKDDYYDDDIDSIDWLVSSYQCYFVCHEWFMMFWHYRVIIYIILWWVLVYVLICTSLCTILICKDPCLIFRNSEYSSNSGNRQGNGQQHEFSCCSDSVRIPMCFVCLNKISC